MLSWCLPLQTLASKMGCGLSSGTVETEEHSYRIIKKIADGGFSSVYLVKDIESRTVYAMKKIIAQTPELRAAGENEIRFLQTFHHPNIIRLVDFSVGASTSVQGSNDILLILPYYPRGSLDKVLKTMAASGTFFTEAEVLSLFHGICQGVQELHRQTPPIAHRDIKPLNVLLGADNTPVLFDFGSATLARVAIGSRQQALQLQELAEEQSSVLYRAPELFEVSTGASVDERTDVWSLGCTLYAIAYGGKSPFEDAYSLQAGSIKLAAMSGQIEFPEYPAYSQEFKELVRWILTPDHTLRPFIGQVIERVQRLQGTTDATTAAESTPLMAGTGTG